MNVFEGIPMSESKLVLSIIFYCLLLVVLLIAAALWAYYSFCDRDKKQIERVKRLRELAKTDEAAKRQLQKLERKEKKRRKAQWEDRAVTVFLGGLIVVCICLILGFGIIPALTDYQKKDYVVYTGELEVSYTQKRYCITLGDGTTIEGSGPFDSDDTYGTVVYTKRSRLLLGGQK